MKPKPGHDGQQDLFKPRLEQILNMDHPLVKLAHDIDWQSFDEKFGELYDQKKGRPGLPTRLMVGLHYLKYAHDCSDRVAVQTFLENPYWQYFCGCQVFQHKLPLNHSSMTRWRKRSGPDGAEELLKVTINTAIDTGQLKRSEFRRINVDTTVQTKAVAFPTDARLYNKARKTLVREAKKQGIELRQSYKRLGKRALSKVSRYNHAKQFRRARKEQKKLCGYLGRVIRDIRRKAENLDEEFEALLERCERIFRRKRKDKNKVYSVHAPEVECISKGKAHKRYEFGCKAAFATTSKHNWIVGAEALHGNPYDGHTLAGTLQQVQRLTGTKAQSVACDKGYRGHKVGKDLAESVVTPHNRGLSKTEKKWLKRRSAIEPVIGHMKSEHRLERNRLKGPEGDKINVLLAAAAFNFKKLLKRYQQDPFLSLIFALWVWFLSGLSRDSGSGYRLRFS